MQVVHKTDAHTIVKKVKTRNGGISMKLTKFGKYTKIGALTLGAVLLFGTTGALELGDISLTQALAQYAVGVFSSLLGLYVVSLEK